MKRVLLDTHALLWWLVDDPLLSDTARAQIAEPATEALVSAVSVWEIAIKRSLGKLPGDEDLLDAVASDGFTWLPVSEQHAWEVANLPHHHADPFDRMLIAQARVEEVPVLTADSHFDAYDVAVSW